MTPGVYNGIVSRHINRRFSVPMARLLRHTPATPNQVSVLSLLIACGALASYATGYYILGGVLAQVSSIVDGVDGDLARLKNMATAFGGFLDAVLDRYADAVILLGLTLWAVDQTGTAWAWVIGFGALGGSLITSYTRARVQGAPANVFDRGITSLASRDVRLFFVMLGSFAGQGLATLAVIAVLTNLVVALRLAQARKALGEREG